MIDKKIILEALVGSKAYGLDDEDSDEDILGIFVEPTDVILGIRKYKETIVSTNPDYAYHEVGKFIGLAMKCNPTILELLFMPEYRTITEYGKLLIDNRHMFLSKTAYYSYGGYAMAQVRKLNARGDSFSASTRHRYSKHARHCFRLLQQGKQLLETGTMDIRVKNREELLEIGKLSVQELVSKFETEFMNFNITSSILPEEPDYNGINHLLLEIRRKN